jgi:hypothetical protein
MKYFGKTVSQNIEKYPGSGARWSNHLSKHNVEPIHLWNSDWYYDTSISRFALKFSFMNRIVESDLWANMKPENGIDGGWERLNDGSEKHIERTRKGRKQADKIIKEKYGVDNISQTEKFKKEASIRIKEEYRDGKRKVSKAFIYSFEGKTHSKESKQKMSGPRPQCTGSKNSQYGTTWIWKKENGNKKIKKDELEHYVNQGWEKTYKPGYVPENL